MTTQTQTTKPYLTITIGSDWGCDHTTEDGQAYAAFAQHALAQAYPGVEVEVTYSSEIGRDKIVHVYSGLDEHDVREELSAAWEAFCAANWPRA